MCSLVASKRPSLPSSTATAAGCARPDCTAATACPCQKASRDLTRKSAGCVVSSASSSVSSSSSWPLTRLLDICASFLALDSHKDMASNNVATTSANTTNTNNNHRAAADHSTTANNRLVKGNSSHGTYPEDHPNFLVYKKVCRHFLLLSLCYLIEFLYCVY